MPIPLRRPSLVLQRRAARTRKHPVLTLLHQQEPGKGEGTSPSTDTSKL
ncbi:MAG: hypothetical protein MJE68_31190 [Proteobacteria bacterium]|nr:hypothetical protein [Pseudomonadota bacterium]